MHSALGTDLLDPPDLLDPLDLLDTGASRVTSALLGAAGVGRHRRRGAGGGDHPTARHRRPHGDPV